MVNCKSAPHSPRKARSVSPRRFSERCSPSRRKLPLVDFGSTEILHSHLNDSRNSLGRLAESLASLPRRDVKILEAMARKRDEEKIRDELASRFSDMWQKEAEERKKIDAEVAGEYRRYMVYKQSCHRRDLERRQLELDIQQDLQRSRIIRDAKERHERSEHLLEVQDHQRRTRTCLHRAIGAARSQHAALRRCDMREEEATRRHHILADIESRVEAAGRKRTRTLRELSYRAAISSGLSQLESARRHREAEIAEVLRREELRADISAKEERVRRLSRARTEAVCRSRQVAALSAALRQALR